MYIVNALLGPGDAKRVPFGQFPPRIGGLCRTVPDLRNQNHSRSLELNELEGSVKERFETRIALALRMFRSAAHGDVERAPQDEWSDRDLQVIDPKAAGALSCPCVVEAI